MHVQSLSPIPHLFHARRILRVRPHHDDNDIGAGGTIAALHAAGAEIIDLTAIDDRMGVLDPAPAAEAAIGVSAHCWLGFPDARPYEL